MTISRAELEGLARACELGELAAFEPAAPRLGWCLTESARVALLRALANTDHGRWQCQGASTLTLTDAIALLTEAATSESGIAMITRPRTTGQGVELAIALRHADRAHFGARYAPSESTLPAMVWPELNPWYEVTERNRGNLQRWAETAEGIVSVEIAERRDPGLELLAAVIADPDDVERRLVYADWLLERGDSRGELIQLCERRLALGQRDRELDEGIARLEREHGARIAGSVGRVARKYTLARGFVSIVEMSARSFAIHGEHLLALHPVDRLDLAKLDNDSLALFANTPAVRQLRGLQLRQSVPASFDELCRGSMFDSLRHFEIWAWQTRGDPLDAFARWRAPRLRSMTLFNVDSAARIVAGIGRNDVVRLRVLGVYLPTSMNWSGATLAGPSFAQLFALRLRSEDAGVEELFDGAELPALETLDIDDAISIERIAFPGLRRLLLRGPVSAPAFEGLLARHPRLESIELSEVDISELDRVLEAALALPTEHPLKTLALPSRAADRELLARARRRFGGFGGLV